MCKGHIVPGCYLNKMGRIKTNVLISELGKLGKEHRILRKEQQNKPKESGTKELTKQKLMS